MTNQLLANNATLAYKLDGIRAHIRKRLDVVEGQPKGELEFILGLIERWEVVPDRWELTEPLVPDINIPVEYKNKENQ